MLKDPKKLQNKEDKAKAQKKQKKAKKLEKIPEEIKEASKKREKTMAVVPKKVNHKFNHYVHKSKQSFSNKIDKQQLKKDLKVTGFLTAFFTGVGLVVYLVKRHK